MRIWLSKNSEVPVREQLVTQVVLGIVSRDLKPGQRLPSTRELARRFGIHSNTVSAAYRDLAGHGWVELRRGSGIYVRGHKDGEGPPGSGLELDQLIAAFLQAARERGHSLAEVQSRLKRLLELQPPDHFVVIESDEELREILVKEVGDATAFRVYGVSPEACAAGAEALAGGLAVALYGQEGERTRAALPPSTPCVLVQARSVQGTMQGQELPPPDALVAVVSRWPGFLRWARTMLVAAGVDPEAISARDARTRGWQRGLTSAAFVITDAVTAALLPRGCDARVFRIIADDSIAELRGFAEPQKLD
jgi:DNA-binding transcriptional regulator YhcF (GntR family)